MTSTSNRVRGIQAPDHLESFERIHVGIQGTRSHSTIQGDGEAGRVPGSPLFTVVLTPEAVPAGRPHRIQIL